METNYTETMSTSDMTQNNLMTWKDLHSLDFRFNKAFILPLVQDQFLHADEVIRILPKKRLVVFGIWQNKPVVAKLFFDPHDAKRHMEKDVAGIQILQENKIPTPALYYQGISADRRIYVLLYERIYESKNLETLWQEKKSPESLFFLLKHVIIELATQHVLGVVQQDMHLKNFLITKKRIYTLDGGQIEQHPHILPKKPSMQSLALFLSQLGIGVHELHEKLFKHYAKARGWLLKPEDVQDLFSLIKKCNDERWSHYEQKIFRDSSHFAYHKDINTFILYDRSFARPELIAFLADPEKIFNDPTTIILKAGRSTTVIKVTFDNHDFVIKRYNIKNMWHRARRALRETRACACWRLAQKLRLFDVATAKPVAFIENRFLNLRSTSYYVTEYVPGIHLVDYLTHIKTDAEKLSHMIQKVSTLFTSYFKLKMSHGDLKTTNILINAEAHPVLIDLDGAKEHISDMHLKSNWKKDIERFLENFNDEEVREQFRQAFEYF